MKKTALTMIALASISSAQAQLYGDGYAILNDKKTLQSDLGQVVVRQIQATTIYDGLQTILHGTGWRLAESLSSDPQIHRLLNAPWPDGWREVGPDQLAFVLESVGGKGWQLVIDPVNRLISYEIQQDFRPATTRFKSRPSNQAQGVQP